MAAGVGSSTFRAALDSSCGARGHLCVGLDPDLDLLPPEFTTEPDSVLRFVTAIIEATAEVAAAYKPNSAFYEVMGPAGMEVLQAVIAAVPGDIPVILDVKRGDIGNTAERYAQAAFDVYGATAVTVSPYMARDSLQPFLDRRDRGVFVLCRTSNAGSTEVQDLLVSGRPLYLEIARLSREWNDGGNVGLVVGATWPEELAAIRAECPDMPILVPGVGAQGGDIAGSVEAVAGPGRDQPFVLSASRSVMHAGRDGDYQHAASDAAHSLRDEIEAALRP